MKKKMLLLIMLAGMLISCTVETTASETPQECPSWTNNEGLCTIALSKQGISSERTYSLGEYDQVKIATIGGEILINDVVGVTFVDDRGETIDHESTRISPSSFIVISAADSEEHTFTLRNPNSSMVVTVALEFVKFQEN